MKNKLFAVLALLSFGLNYAQEETKSRENEVKVNFLNTITIASVEIGYERFFGNDQSVGFEIFINDRFSYAQETQGRKFETNSFALSYNFYFSGKNNSSGYYLSPFFKYRFGDYVKNEDIGGILTKVSYDISSPIVGLGIGYKWLWNEKLTVGVGGTLGRNFSKDVQDLFVAVEPNANITVGYRF